MIKNQATRKQITFDFIFITLLGAIFFAAFTGSYHLISPDEGRYIGIAREMVASGNYITPHLDGTVFLDKPILFYWVESLLLKVFGFHEWSVRILPEFCGLLGVWFNYFAGLKLYNRRTGLLAALVLMTMLLYFMAGHYTNMDLMVAVLMSCSLWLFLLAVQLPLSSKRTWTLWFSYVFAALAFLTKGLMGLAFPAMIIGIWILCLRRWRLILRMRLITGLIIFALIISPWLYLAQMQNSSFLDYFFVIQQFSRYLTPHFNMHQPFYYYAVIVILGIMPWTIFFFQSMRFTIKGLRTEGLQKQDKELFIFLWPLLIFIFFSIPESKIPGYIIPVFPPIAMLIARYFDLNWRRLARSRSLKICSWVFLVFGVIASFALIYTARLTSISTAASFYYLCGIAFIIMVGAVTSVAVAYYNKNFKVFLVVLLATTMMADIVGIASVWTFKLDNVKMLALKIKSELKPGDKVVTYRKFYQDLPTYLNQNVYVVDDWHDVKQIVRDDNWHRELAEGIIYQHYQQPYLIGYKKFAAMWDQKNYRVFALTSLHKVNLLKQNVKAPVYRLAVNNGVILLSNEQ
jgi:4-amino-4-deoxy-L-arabinose transferase-like glycosyltransferase